MSHYISRHWNSLTRRHKYNVECSNQPPVLVATLQSHQNEWCFGAAGTLGLQGHDGRALYPSDLEIHYIVASSGIVNPYGTTQDGY